MFAGCQVQQHQYKISFSVLWALSTSAFDPCEEEPAIVFGIEINAEVGTRGLAFHVICNAERKDLWFCCVIG